MKSDEFPFFNNIINPKIKGNIFDFKNVFDIRTKTIESIYNKKINSV